MRLKDRLLGARAAHRSRRARLTPDSERARVLMGGLAVALAALAARGLYGPATIGYDASYALLWGRQIEGGHLPQFQSPRAPTPHPLANLWSAMAAPLHAAAAAQVIEAFSFVAMGGLALAAFLLGARLFAWPVGLLFAAIVLTRPAIAVEVTQTGVDIPFLALVTTALAIEARPGARKLPVMAVLAVAGLMRPEAWALAGAYAVHAWPRLDEGGRRRLLVLAASAPVIWLASDALVTGDPLYSLHGTRELAVQLNRPRGLHQALSAVPSSLAVVLGSRVAWVGFAGALAASQLLFRRALLPGSILTLGLLAFIVLGAADLPVLPRYMLLPSLMLALFAAVGALGWLVVGNPAIRMAWMLAAAGLVLLLALQIPDDRRATDQLRQFSVFRASAVEQLDRLIATPAVARRLRSGVVNVESSAALPLVALRAGRSARDLRLGPPPPHSGRLAIAYNSDLVRVRFGQDERWPTTAISRQVLAANRSWVAYAVR